MAAIKTINFLPQVFRTDTNQKFLNATLDQLITPPDLRKVNAYIGRKFAPAFKSSDNYQPEPSALRQNYQLEPGVVVTDKTNTVDFFSSYIDLLNQVSYDGGIATNQSRLFENEVYSFDGLVDFDKLVNFNQYYWMPNGPESVEIYGTPVPKSATYTVTRDPGTGAYRFSSAGSAENPTLKLARGGTYQFVVDQPGFPFWIQSSPGTSGLKDNQSNLSSRDVLGVTNNGTEVGTITFTVPQANAQSFYTNMPLVATVDASTNLHYTQIQGATASQLTALGGLDGITSQYDNKNIIFTNVDIDNSLWTVNSVTVPTAQRRNTWRITYVNPTAADPTINLVPVTAVTANQRVYVTTGQTQAEYTFYLDANLNYYVKVPDLTASMGTIYYQDGITSAMAGALNLISITDVSYDVATILGQKTYTSPNGVVFTNGLKIVFDSNVVPSTYAGNAYYVEGVGSSIQLVDAETLITPESYATNGINTPDYITISRASQDLNPWTRSNRWFHASIITAAATYNNTVPVYDQSTRAQRPIIEFEADLQLYNFGRAAKAPVDIFDTTITDARNQIELQPYFVLDGIALSDGMRVVFANDFDPTVRDQIFIVNISEINQTPVITLSPATDYAINPYNNLVVLQGTNQGIEYYYNGTTWIPGQQKTSVNQTPVFDVVDANGISLGDTAVYANSTFAGTEIFSYAVGTGTAVDPVLGFALSYKNFNQVGDIEFVNNFDNDQFQYGPVGQTTTANVSNTGFIRQNTSLTSYSIRNVWTTVVEKSKQYQLISSVYDGTNNNFEIDILPDAAVSIPYLKVFQNFTQLDTTDYAIVGVGVKNYLQITSSILTANDQIDILIYSNQDVSSLGFYQVPDNLNYNSENINFTTGLTLGQLRNHLIALVSNSNSVTGTALGNNNLRDYPVKQQGGNILQHASPIVYSELFTVDTTANFAKSLEYARHNYSRFKNKILESAVNLKTVDTNNISGVLDSILVNINSAKNNTFAWYYSDMVPYGPLKSTLTYTVLDADIVDYEINSVFNDTVLSNRAVLVYLNNVQLTKNQDYTFDTVRSGITFVKTLTVGDIITINDYSSTDGNYVPETPTKLGLYPKFTPMIYTDNTYVNPISVIQGHDGSITPTFGDFRDQLLLEFELRIYNNIKVNYQDNVNDVYNFLPGKFRTTGYTNAEFTRLLTRSFLQWVGNNRVDFTDNSYFIATDPFTWNYSRFTDTINGEQLPGTWRAIYKYFYDTDRPNTNPWEMLGFSEQPTWWQTRYGPAPYTGGNIPLWTDLSQGLVWNNGNSYTDSRFVRSDLLNIIPVDANGNLRAPTEFAVRGFNSNLANGSYAVGQQGPVETAWRRSSDFPYAVQQALALANPAFYFGSLIDVSRYYKNSNLNQYILSDTLQRITPTAVNINGQTSGATILRTAGYLNWIADYLRNQGIDPTVKISGYLDNVNIQLVYKMAGYSDNSFIEVIAEQASPTSTSNSVVVPNENYKIQLNKSTPTQTVTYSAVIVEKSANGYTVSGYDTSNPYFTIIPSLANANAYTVTAINDVGVIYQDFQNYKLTVPYGFEFTNKQQVVDFLVSYQRYLKGLGIVFQDQDPNLGTQRDFILSVQEFLTWAQQGWQTSSVLVLSPILDHLVIVTTSGVIDQIENTPQGTRVLDTGYNFIKYNNLTVNRYDNTFSLTTTAGQTIALAELDVVEYEHVLIFDNITAFSDVIYVPELGNRQYRLKLVGQKTGSWTGVLNPPGFIYNSPQVDAWQAGIDYPLGSLVQFKSLYYTTTQDLVATATFNPAQWQQLQTNQLQTGLLPNFSYNAAKAQKYMSLDDPELQGDFVNYVGSQIGFTPRQYLTNFGIDVPTQAKFYQGYIRQKGSLNAVTGLTAVGFNDITSNITVTEEWAFRVGEYGALNNNQYVEVPLTEGVFNGDPVTFTLLANGATTTDNVVPVYPANLYLTGSYYTPTIYSNRTDASDYTNDIMTAGYVNLSDIDIQIFDMANYASLDQYLGNIGIGTKIWAARDTSTTSWNVYRVTETNYSITKFAYDVDVIATVTVNRPHNLVYGEYVVVMGFDTRVNGFYQVYSVVDAYNFTVVVPAASLTVLKSVGSISGLGPVYTLNSMRLKTSTDVNSIAPANGWLVGDKLWADYDQNIPGWAVYNKSLPWTSANLSPFAASMQLDANSYATGTGFGTVTTVSPGALFSAAGMPTLNTGNVRVFVSNVANGYTFTSVANLGAATFNSVTNYGASLASTDSVLYVGHPGDGATQYGAVHVYQFDGNAGFTLSQTLTSPAASNIGDLYGYSVSADVSGTWLYVGAPNAGNVYVYHNTSGTYTYANTIAGNSYVSGGNAGATQFGHIVDATTDGSRVSISSPYERVNGVASAGAVYVFDRSRESLIASGQTAFYTHYPIDATTIRVTVNGNVVTTGFTSNSSAVTFTNAPVIGTTVTIDTNKIQLLEQLTAPTPTSGATFGIVSSIAGNDADVYVSSPGYSTPGYHSGIVYRFVNSGANYGTITSTNFNATVTSGDSFFINGQYVTWTGTTLANVAVGINAANIAGVTATIADYGLLNITSNSTVTFQKLLISPGSGTALADIGLSTFANSQAIMHPGTSQVNDFGAQVVSTANSDTMVISASRGATYNSMTFDKDTTIFDTGSTSFFDGNEGSGVVYVYGLVESPLTSTVKDQYVLVQQLENASVSTNDQFGYSLALAANVLLIGAPGDSNHTTFDPVSQLIVNIPSAGTYYTYENLSGNIGWDIISSEQPKVDLASVTRSYIYNTTTSTLLTNFDYIDPAKGKILGAAQQDLDYITAYDPAVYNAVGGVDSVPNVSYNLDFHWGAAQVTKTWWDLSQVRYLDYEQGTVSYRAAHWGAMFPGSNVQVAEWVESSVLPSQYTGSGTPLYPNDTAYIVESYVDPTTKIIRSRYFYWVINKATVEINSAHTNSVLTIKSIIENPQAQGIPYIAAVRDDSISIYNFSDYLIGAGNTVVFHADYDTLQNTNVIHSEYALVAEGDTAATIPTRIIDKIIDSLAGIDAMGNSVPSLGLPVQARYGLGVNPNQTIFVDRISALTNFFEYVNNVLTIYPITQQFDMSQLEVADPVPAVGTYDFSVATHADLSYVDTSLLNAYTTLVLVSNDETENGAWVLYQWSGTVWSAVGMQQYNTADYWGYVDWYVSGFNSSSKITYLVDTYSALATLTPAVNELAQVANRGNGQFAVYQYNGTTWNLVGLEKGTIQFNSLIYGANIGTAMRLILTAIQEYFTSTNFDVLFASSGTSFNGLIFVMINYIFSEQKSVDWAFKTSFLKVVHQLRELLQYPIYMQDNQTYYEDYINEVKPYRTSIREYLVDYTGSDQYSGDATDFDIPATYISNVGGYRSPDGSVVSDAYALSNLPQYREWYTNHSYGIDQVLVGNVGIGYTLPPAVTVVGGGGTGANIQAIVDFSTNTVVSFDVISPGQGYTSTPTIVINGTGIGAAGYPILVGEQFITSVPVQVISLSGTASVTAGNIVTQPNSGAYGTVAVTSSGNTITLNNVVGTFVTDQYILETASNLNVRVGVPTTTMTVSANVSVTAGDIINQTYGNATITAEVWSNSTGNVLTLWNTSGTFAGNSWLYDGAANLSVLPTYFVTNSNATPVYSYTTFEDQSYNKVRTFTETIVFDRTTYASNITLWQPNVTITAGTWVSYAGRGYEAQDTVYSTATLKLNSNISSYGANIGQYLEQVNNTAANAQITSISIDGTVVTVANVVGTFEAWAGNLILSNLLGQTTTTSMPVVVNNIFDYSQYTELSGNGYTNAADRIFASYQPTTSMPGRDLSQLMTGIDYPGVQIQGVPFNAISSNITSNVVYFYSNSSTLYSGNTGVTDFTLYGFQTALPITIVDHGSNTAANVTILNFNNSELRITGPMSDITLGNTVSIVYYDYNNPTYLDTTIQSFYTDTALGTRPQDINIDGGAYYDTYSSHAPEELVPGITFDNLNMMVYTGVNHWGNTLPNPTAGYTGNVGYRYVHNMNANAAGSYGMWPEYYAIFASNTSTLSANLHLTDSNIHVVNASAFITPNLNVHPPIPGVVYINGEKIIYWTIDYTNNILGQLRRAVDGTGAANVHAIGSAVVEVSANQLIPTANIVTANVHTTSWLNMLGNATISYIADSSGNNIVDELGDLFITVPPTLLEFIMLSGNVTVSAGDYVTQPSTGANGVVAASTTGAFITVWAANISGTFASTITTANTYIYHSNSNTHTIVNRIAYTEFDGTGLDGSQTPQALFIKGFN